MTFTRHVLQRMALRNVDRLDVEIALATATRTTDRRRGTTSHRGRTLDGHAIVVVTAPDDHDHVITVILTKDS